MTEPQFYDLYEQGSRKAQAGDPAGALADWLDAFRRSRGIAGLEEVRLTLILDDMAALGEGYDPALKALAGLRDAAEKNLEGKSPAIEDADELVALNSRLAGPERNLAVYDRYRIRPDANPEIVQVLRDLLWGDLVEARRFNELADEAANRAAQLIPVMERAQKAMAEQSDGPSAPPPHEGDSAGSESDSGDGPPAVAPLTSAQSGNEEPEGAGEIWHEDGEDSDLVDEALDLFTVLLGAHRYVEAQDLGRAILKLEPEAEQALIDAGTMVGDPDAARLVLKLLPPSVDD